MEFAVAGAAADPEDASRLGPVAAGLFQGAHGQALLVGIDIRLHDWCQSQSANRIWLDGCRINGTVEPPDMSGSPVEESSNQSE